MPHDHEELEVEGAHLNTWRNWAGTVHCRPAVVTSPWSLKGLKFEIQAARQYGQTLRMAGSGHSFSPLCETDGRVLTLKNYSGLVSVDRSTCKVRVRGGTTLNALGRILADNGLALENMGDIDAQAVVGAMTTGTHGTGMGFGVLATQMTGLNLLLADGSELWCSSRENAEIFSVARISLGALGIITEVELQCVPDYRLAYECRTADLDDTLVRLDEYRSRNRNFEFYWFPHTDRVQLKFMNRTDRQESGGRALRKFKELTVENGAFGLLSRTVRRFPSQCERVSRFMANAVPSHGLVLPAREIYASKRLVRFVECEYSLPLDAIPEVLHELRTLIGKQRLHVHFPIEVRYVAADDIALSPAYGRDSAYVAVHMYRGMPYEAYFDACEALFDQYDGRPHWGKLHGKSATELSQLYPEWARFQTVRAGLDPTGLFMNQYLQGLLKHEAPVETAV